MSSEASAPAHLQEEEALQEILPEPGGGAKTCCHGNKQVLLLKFKKEIHLRIQPDLI